MGRARPAPSSHPSPGAARNSPFANSISAPFFALLRRDGRAEGTAKLYRKCALRDFAPAGWRGPHVLSAPLGGQHISAPIGFRGRSPVWFLETRRGAMRVCRSSTSAVLPGPSAPADRSAAPSIAGLCPAAHPPTCRAVPASCRARSRSADKAAPALRPSP
jgi:hypothetical protein